MNTRAIQRFRRRLAAGDVAAGLWVTFEAPSITEMAVGLGLDWVVVDAEHGHLDLKEICEHVRAAVRSDTAVLVRIAALDRGTIKRVLDIGADGIVIPWTETAEEVRAAVAYAKYPPAGQRGVGAERATAWCEAIPQHIAESNDHVLVIPLIESETAGRNLDAMLEIDGADTYFFGPHDWAASVGAAGAWGGGRAGDEILEAVGKIRAAGKHCGIVAAGPDLIRQRIDEGYRMIAVGIDGLLMLRSLHEALDALGRDRTLDASLRVPAEDAAVPPIALRRIPQAPPSEGAVRIVAQGEGRAIAITDAVRVDFHAGHHADTPGLSAGLVEFAPGAALPRHLHPFTEALTVLEGQVQSDVEGRRYLLGPGDTAVIRRELAHLTSNVSKSERALCHIVMASGDAKPEQTPVDKRFKAEKMPPDSPGTPDGERVMRAHGGEFAEVAPGVRLRLLYDEWTCPGVEISAVRIVLAPGAALPPHCLEGAAAVFALDEGLRVHAAGAEHDLPRRATALLPAAAVHRVENAGAHEAAAIVVSNRPRMEWLVVDDEADD